MIQETNDYAPRMIVVRGLTFGLMGTLLERFQLIYVDFNTFHSREIMATGWREIKRVSPWGKALEPIFLCGGRLSD